MLPDPLIEKAKNEKLDPIAQARVLKKLIVKFGLTNREIAKHIGKSSSYVSNALRLLTLPEALKDGLVSGLITSGHARALAAIGNQRMMITAYKQILRQEGSVRKAEALARRIKRGMAKKTQKKKADYVFERMKREISQALGGAKVDLSRSRVRAQISISLKGSYKKTERWFRKIHHRLTRPSFSGGQ